MKKSFKLIAVAVLTLTMLAGCKKKNPVEGKKFNLKIAGENIVYVFSADKMWMEGHEQVKMDYRYEKESDSIILTEFDGVESTIPMSQLKVIGKK